MVKTKKREGTRGGPRAFRAAESDTKRGGRVAVVIDGEGDLENLGTPPVEGGGHAHGNIKRLGGVGEMHIVSWGSRVGHNRQDSTCYDEGEAEQGFRGRSCQRNSIR